MSVQPSRKLEAGCPRCGVRIEKPFKYCPNCAYRLRPAVTTALPPPIEDRRPSRVLALGGYLAFGSLFLLVILAGIRLFTEDDVFLGEPAQTGVVRDTEVFVPDRADGFRRVEPGAALWGAYVPPEASITESTVDDPIDMCVFEVTNDQFFEFLLARGKKKGSTPAHFYPVNWRRVTGDTVVRRIYGSGNGNLPVTSVGYLVALEYCAWYWERYLGSDPNVLVDIPTADEFVRAGRGERVEFNFPWGSVLEPRKANLEGSPVDVRDYYWEKSGFASLIGNAAEWVHTEDGPAAAGWSFLDGLRYEEWDDPDVARKPTPFSRNQVQPASGQQREDVGFRIVLRPASALPRFVSVPAGPVRMTVNHAPAFEPPWPRGAIAQDQKREPPVEFAERTARVERNFEIAQSEITNRQYLAFLVARSNTGTKIAELWNLLPESFTRPHPFADWTAFIEKHGDPREVRVERFSDLIIVSEYLGPLGDPRRIPYIYDAGTENRPVQGVTRVHAEAYAAWLSRALKDGTRVCRLPTVAEFLRAGRRDTATPYPWGDDPLRRELICSGRRDEQNRGVSLAGWFGTPADRIYGLAGNLPEIVVLAETNRYLLAGGFFRLPAELCTLDTFMDADWDYIEVRGQEVRLGRFTGFRVVRIAQF